MNAFMKEFQNIYKDISMYEDIRYNLEVDLYNKYKKGLPPTKKFPGLLMCSVFCVLEFTT